MTPRDDAKREGTCDHRYAAGDRCGKYHEHEVHSKVPGYVLFARHAFRPAPAAPAECHDSPFMRRYGPNATAPAAPTPKPCICGGITLAGIPGEHHYEDCPAAPTPKCAYVDRHGVTCGGPPEHDWHTGAFWQHDFVPTPKCEHDWKYQTREIQTNGRFCTKCRLFEPVKNPGTAHPFCDLTPTPKASAPHVHKGEGPGVCTSAVCAIPPTPKEARAEEYARGDWICEFCFRFDKAQKLPPGWDWVWQSAVCPSCREKVKADGGYAVVKGGAYATVPDPRADPPAAPEVLLHRDDTTKNWWRICEGKHALDTVYEHATFRRLP